LVRTPAGVWIVDLRSASTTLVNGVPVQFAQLADGDELAFGSNRLRFSCGRSASRILSAFALPARRSESEPHGARLQSRDPSDSGRRAGSTSALPDQSLTLELLREISRQQSETAEQFRQVLVLLFRMHQDQMSVINGELGRLGRLIEGRSTLGSDSGGPSPVPEDIPGRTPSLAAPVPPQGSDLLSDLQAFATESPEPHLAEPRLHGNGAQLQPFATESPEPHLAEPQVHGNGAQQVPAPDPQGDYHLLLARRLAEVQKAGQGRMKQLLRWLSPEAGTEQGLEST
jgi:hypothetical protein